MAYQDAQNQDCFANGACRLPAKKSLIALGPYSAIEDITDPKWWLFDQFLMLTNFEISRSDDTVEEDVLGLDDPFWKSTKTTWTFSGDAYYCKNDISLCRIGLEQNCFAWVVVPCGEPYLHDLHGNNPKPEIPNGPVNGDPIGDGEVVTIGIGTANQYTESFAPGDCIRTNFSGLAKCVTKFNTCVDFENFDEDYVPPGEEPFTLNESGFLVPERVAA